MNDTKLFTQFGLDFAWMILLLAIVILLTPRRISDINSLVDS